jgi:putative protein-disulfide isomerase
LNPKQSLKYFILNRAGKGIIAVFVIMCFAPALPAQKKLQPEKSKMEHKVKLIYFTDPICSACWSIEGQFRKLLLEYGNYLEVEFRMGGLLQSWDTYDAAGISKPADVAHHWDEMSKFSGMPVKGDVWLKDPLPSSFPPCLAVKAAEIQDKKKTGEFLRRLREIVMTGGKNICRWIHIQDAAVECGLDTTRLRSDFYSKARDLFEQDLSLASKFDVHGFPAIFFIDGDKKELVYGVHAFADYEKALKKLVPDIRKAKIPIEPLDLFKSYKRLAQKEISEIMSLPMEKVKEKLELLRLQGKVKEENGLWSIKS